MKKDCEISFFPTLYGGQPKCKASEIRVTEADFVKWEILSINSHFRQHTEHILVQAKKMVSEIQQEPYFDKTN